jgi:hypothetical protein
MEEFRRSQSPDTEMPLDSNRNLVSNDPNNLPLTQMPKSGFKEAAKKLPPNEMHDRLKRANGEESPLSPQVHPQYGLNGDNSPARKTSDAKEIPENATSLSDEDDPSPKNANALSMRDPSDSANERSKAFNIFFGLSFASGGFYFGYSLAMLSPLGEKWLKFNFDIIDNAATFLGIANLLVAIGVGIGSTVSSILCEKYGRVKLLFYSEIMMMCVHSFMWVHNIWLFLV